MRWKQEGTSRRDILKTFAYIPLATLPLPLAAQSRQLHFSCREDDDLYREAVSSGISCMRYENETEAVSSASRGSAVLVLAQGYPHTPTSVGSDLLHEAVQKQLRLYIEFPASLPGVEVGKPTLVSLGKLHNVLERAVITSDSFGPALPPMHILSLHECYYTPVASGNPEMVLARVAGFDTAVFGLPKEGVQPILFKHPRHDFLIATTQLSSFLRGRYAPAAGWADVWRWILSWLVAGQGAQLRQWTPAVHPTLARDSRLPDASELVAFRKGTSWFGNARLFVAPQWKGRATEYAKSGEPHFGPGPSWPVGDGSDGLLEGFSTTINWQGKQPVGWNLRADCAGETSMAMALAGAIGHNTEESKIAANLNDFIYSNSVLASGPRDDPHSPSFGLLGWSVPGSAGTYYGDDNARSLLGTMAASALLKSDRWNEKVLRCLLANLRTTGVYGFRPNRITQSQLQKFGWRHFYDATLTNYHPHFEAYPWACFLRAYDQTHFPTFLDRTRTGIRMTMKAYPNQWRWTNGFQQERARMLLPLAWLIRVEDKPEYRGWLRRIATDMLAFQIPAGGIREVLGNPSMSPIPPPASNAQYGTSEVSLIQRNGNPACDLLYTCNFAFLGLHEAAAATGESLYSDAENKLASFFCRIQIESKSHPELAGGWFRAFDGKSWDYWASSSDWGWGPWSIETGWTQTWICSILGLRHLKMSLWELTGRNDLRSHLDKLTSIMFD